MGAGKWQTSGIKAAKSLGLKVIALDSDPDAFGFNESDIKIVVDIKNPKLVLNKLKSSNINLNGIISYVTDSSALTSAEIRDFYNLPGPSQKLAKSLINKSIQRNIWKEANLPIPKFIRLNNTQNIEESLVKNNIKYPIIIKPTDSGGSRGISVISKANQLTEAVRSAINHSKEKYCILESFIRGKEFTVETFGCNGKHYPLAVTKKRKVKNTNNTVADQLITLNINSPAAKEIYQLASKSLIALGYLEGPGHTEIIKDFQGKLWLVECAGRGGGFMVNDGLVPLASGFDLASETIKSALGICDLSDYNNRNKSVVLRFVPSREGRVTSISGFDLANQIKGVQAEPIVVVGDVTKGALTDGGRLAWILSEANSTISAIKNADQAEKLIKIEIENV